MQKCHKTIANLENRVFSTSKSLHPELFECFDIAHSDFKEMGDAHGVGRRAAMKFHPSTPRLRFSGDRSWPLHPFLFAIAPVLAMYARNLEHSTFAGILPALVGTLIFAMLVYLVVAASRRSFDRLSAVIASIWIVGCLFYLELFGRLNHLLDGGYPMVRSLPVAIVALVAATMVALLARRATPIFHSMLTGIALFLLVGPTWEAVRYEWENAGALAAYDPERSFAQLSPYMRQMPKEAVQPDIYHFIFDRYASEDILRRHYGFDNEAIGRFLQAHGFYVAHASNSNYQKTGHSLASTFHMDYLDFLEEDERVKGKNWRPIYKMLGDHRVARFLKSRGYELVQFGSWWAGTYHSAIADENRPRGFSEFEMLYLRRTILRPLFHALPDTALTMRLDWDNAQCQRVAAQVEEVKSVGARDKPVYVFAHFLLPHGPYNFSSDGQCLSQEASAKRGAERGFVEQIAYANHILREVIPALQRPDRPLPIIIVQADEGPFPKRDNRIPWQEATAEELRIKTGIMNAYFFPNADYSALRQDITPINSYRVLFNSVFGTDFPLLPDRIYAFPNDATLYEFHGVTEKVRGPTAVASETAASPGEE